MSDPKRVLLIPAFNEARHLGGVLEGLGPLRDTFEIVVIDDGSEDETARIASAAGARVLRHPYNLGYGAALQTGYKYAYRAGASFVVQMDADGQHDPADVPTLVAEVESGALDLAIGSRFLEEASANPAGDTGYRMGALRGVGRGLFRALARRLGLELTDPTSGFQALNRRVLRLYVQDFFPSDYPDVDVLLAAHREGLRIGERRVVMSAAPRASLLHGGLAPVYYVYKMLLSLWVSSQGSRPKPAAEGRNHDDPS